jgi:hypothetical protein
MWASTWQVQSDIAAAGEEGIDTGNRSQKCRHAGWHLGRIEVKSPRAGGGFRGGAAAFLHVGISGIGTGRGGDTE